MSSEQCVLVLASSQSICKCLYDEAIRYRRDAYGCFRDHFCVSQGKNRCYLRRRQIFIPKSIIFSSSSLTLFFLLFTSLFPPFSQFQKMGGTWEVLGRNMGGTFSFYLRYFFAFHSIPKRSSIEDKAKFYRRPIEHLSKTYRTSIEDLSKTYRRRGEEGAEREQRGSRGRIWLQSYKIPKSHFHLFGR